MAINHRFLEELIELEQNQNFCNAAIQKENQILIIGTFNPSDESCKGENEATWFYGRNRSKFWRYFPTALTGQSLHPNDGAIGQPQTWKNYCTQNNVVIIDLIKSIDTNEVLENFSDREVDSKINQDLTNTSYFDIQAAFQKVKFQKVIYSLRWTDPQIKRLIRIRDIINKQLLEFNCINDPFQIKCCLTPSRNDAFNSWNEAINQ